MDALREMTRVTARVLRGGRALEIPARRIVPGDIVLVEGGDVVTADLRIVEASRLQADESALTGESVPVDKDPAPAERDAPLAERTSLLFKGTAVTRGTGKGLVHATGMDTELGRISRLVEEAESEATPLEKRLDSLAVKLIYVTLGLMVLLAGGGILAGRDALLMIKTAVALAVATIPEGLPVVATLALARGMWRMARRNALVRRLSSVETLGATGVICTDKTGTLTENRMTVTRLVLPGSEIDVGAGADGGFRRGEEEADPGEAPGLKAVLEAGVLCNNASLGGEEEKAVGDPMEAALLEAGRKAGLDRPSLLEARPEIREVSFDPSVKMMATYHEEDGGIRVAVKGAPEAVLEACSRRREGDEDAPMEAGDRDAWRERNEGLASEGLRVLAAATKTVEREDEAPYEGLIFLGLFGLLDPPRKDVKDAVVACRRAGMRVVMVTGDQAQTARSIARQTGLAEEAESIEGRAIREPGALEAGEEARLRRCPVFHRVSPESKLRLVGIHQAAGSVVAMTGDGVNDAPALKRADIGVAMGKRGTQVAREASDMVLKDDAFPTIVEAVRQGRIIFLNIRKFVFFLLSCNVSEVLAVSGASLLGLPLPILPLQILFLNLVTDVFPALALGVGGGSRDILDRPPRDADEPVLTTGHWAGVGAYGALITGAVLVSLLIALRGLGMEASEAVTVSFLTLAFAQLVHVFDMRDRGSGLLDNAVVRNPFVWGALALCAGLILAAVWTPPLAAVLSLSPPGWKGWAAVAACAAAPVLLGQLDLALRRRPRGAPDVERNLSED